MQMTENRGKIVNPKKVGILGDDLENIILSEICLDGIFSLTHMKEDGGCPSTSMSAT